MKSKQTKKIAFFIFSLMLGFFVSFSVFAANNLNIDWPDSPMGTGVTGLGPNSLSNLTQYFYEWGISIGALFAFISIVVAGFKYLTSTGDTNKLTEAKNRIKAAFFGLALLLGTYLILNTINPQLVSLEIKNDPFNDNPLLKQSFVSYEFTSECAFAKLYEDGKSAEEDKKSKYENVKTSGIGTVIKLDQAYRKVNANPLLGSMQLDFNIYNAVKFFGIPTLFKVTTTYEKDNDGNISPKVSKEPVEPINYPDGYKRFLIKGEGGDEYYIEAIGNECKLYMYYEQNCAAISDLWGGVANVSYSTNNLADYSTANPDQVKCYKLVGNK